MGKVDDESLSRLVAVTGPAGSSNAALAAAVTSVRNAPAGSCAVILVEGVSDQSAVEALAARRGRNLRQEGIFVVPMGGATNIGHFLDLLARAGCAPGWRACATRGRSAISGAAWNGPGWGRAWIGPAWPGSVSSSASPTWRTS